MKATAGVMFVADDIQLSKVDASAFLTKEESSNMAALLCMQFLSNASLESA